MAADEIDEITRIMVDCMADAAKDRIASGSKDFLDILIAGTHSADPERAGALKALGEYASWLEGVEREGEGVM